MIKAEMLMFQKPPIFGGLQIVDSVSASGADDVYPKTDDSGTGGTGLG
jgi:hypothetical protein